MTRNDDLKLAIGYLRAEPSPRPGFEDFRDSIRRAADMIEKLFDEQSLVGTVRERITLVHGEMIRLAQRSQSANYPTVNRWQRLLGDLLDLPEKTETLVIMPANRNQLESGEFGSMLYAIETLRLIAETTKRIVPDHAARLDAAALAFDTWLTPYTDDNGSYWTHCTPEAYARVCKARDGWQAEAERLVSDINTTRGILEQCLSVSIKADPQDAPFGMSAEDAGPWHAARREAFRHALEMMPVEKVPSSHRKPNVIPHIVEQMTLILNAERNRGHRSDATVFLADLVSWRDQLRTAYTVSSETVTVGDVSKRTEFRPPALPMPDATVMTLGRVASALERIANRIGDPQPTPAASRNMQYDTMPPTVERNEFGQRLCMECGCANHDLRRLCRECRSVLPRLDVGNPTAKITPDHPPYITVTQGGSGWMAVQMTWDAEDQVYEVWTTGVGRYPSRERAVDEAKTWASADQMQFRV